MHPCQEILDQLAAIRRMERGKLTEEFRTRTGRGGREVRVGPYYKLQVWEDGRNRSRRVPAAEVPGLRDDIANFERFTELTAALAREIIDRTRTARRARSGPARGAARGQQERSTGGSHSP